MFKYFFDDKKTSTNNKNYDSRVLMIIFVLLLLIGFLVILSCAPDYKILFKSSSYYRYISHIIKQFGYIFVGLIFFVLTAFVFNYKKYQKLHFWIYAFSSFLMIVPFFCRAHKGAHRWIEFFGVSFQPSELMKIAIIIVIADFISRKQKYINIWKYNTIPIIYFSIFAVLISVQKDLGTFMLLAATYLLMFFVAGLSYKKLGTYILVLLSSLAVLVIVAPHRIKRLLDFKNPFVSISDAAYNIKISLIAFGSGGLFGKGPGNSEMKLEHLPERHTDYIFPILGEEYGFFGTMVVIFLFVMLMNTGLSISKNCRDDFGKYLAFGITVTMTMQVLINMLMTTNLIPSKGLPLPFISYGGSSMLISCLMVGILFNISRSK